MNVYYQVGWNLFKFFGNVFFSFRVVHPERMIEEGPAILAMNHQSFLDPPLAGICTQRELHTLARKSLFDWPVVGKLMPKINVIGVDRERGGDIAALKLLIQVVKKGGATLLFPEGTRTKDGNLQPAKSGVGLIIAKTLAPVVPMRIFGAFEALPRNGKEFHPIPITIVLGEPLRFTKADLEGGREAYQRLSDRVMEAIAAIQYEE
jgi:1-acyl-sn-glycerol-3-phosphate acyltransferase